MYVFAKRLLSLLCISGIIILVSACSKTTVDVITEQPQVPVITFESDTIHLGRLAKGARAPMVFDFTNTGNTDLLIEIVTTCKCTSIDWPREPIAPGEKGSIQATYDTSDQPIGPVKKTLDIVANTDPIVVEAFFTAEVVAP